MTEQSTRDRVAAMIQDTIDRLKAAERTIVCRPEDEATVRALVTGQTHLKVQVNHFGPPGKVYVLNENGLLDV